MEKSPHVIMSGDGAVKFARSMGHPYYDPTTEKAINRLKEARKQATSDQRFQVFSNGIVDTVGAVANYDGKVAAALSTGGSVPMLRGRVGDTGIPGAGIFVKGDFGIAATGTGEEIIKKMLSYYLYCSRDKLADAWKDIAEKDPYPLGVVGFNGNEHFILANRQMAYGFEER
jgi:L-asparaginase/beta-aspartyl-peptidase (threonine type)